VVNRDLAWLEIDVALLDPVAAAVHPRAAGVLDRRVTVDADGVVRLEILGGDVLEERPPRVAVHPVADRPPGDAAVRDLHQVVELARTVPAGIEHVRARAVAGRSRVLRALARERAAEDVEEPRQRVRAAAERG